MNKTSHPRTPSGATDREADALLDELQALWDCRNGRLDSLMEGHAPLALPQPSLPGRLCREHRATVRRHMLAACFLLLMLMPATLAAQQVAGMRVRHLSDMAGMVDCSNLVLKLL